MKKIKLAMIILFSLVFLVSLIARKSAEENGYSISELKCVGCEACVDACPVQAISIRGGKAVIDQTKCIQCGICVGGNFDDYTGCPVKAISPPPEEEEAILPE